MYMIFRVMAASIGVLERKSRKPPLRFRVHQPKPCVQVRARGQVPVRRDGEQSSSRVNGGSVGAWGVGVRGWSG